MEPTSRLYLTRAEATAWITAAPAHANFGINCRASQALAPCAAESPSQLDTTLAVPLSRADALDIVQRYLSDDSEASGRRIPCDVFRPSAGRPWYWIG